MFIVSVHPLVCLDWGTGKSTGEGILEMPSVPVCARLLVLGIANLVGLCGERIVMERLLLLSIGMFSGRAHSMCLLLSCISLTPTVVHSPYVDGLHGHGNASTFSGPGINVLMHWAVLLRCM